MYSCDGNTDFSAVFFSGHYKYVTFDQCHAFSAE